MYFLTCLPHFQNGGVYREKVTCYTFINPPYRVPSASLICILVTGCDSSIGLGASTRVLAAGDCCSVGRLNFTSGAGLNRGHQENKSRCRNSPRTPLTPFSITLVRITSSVYLFRLFWKVSDRVNQNSLTIYTPTEISGFLLFLRVNTQNVRQLTHLPNLCPAPENAWTLGLGGGT